MKMLIAALGGALGVVLRMLIGKLIPNYIMELPTSILIVNVIGCLAMGLLTEFMSLYWSPTDNIRYFLVSGLLGGFTTFSSFALECGFLLEKQAFTLLFIYMLLSVFLGLLSFLGGMWIVRWF